MEALLDFARMLFSSPPMQITVVALLALAVAGYALHVIKAVLASRK